jgi:hypothetical protein
MAPAHTNPNPNPQWPHPHWRRGGAAQFRREWCNPFPEGSARGKMAAQKRAARLGTPQQPTGNSANGLLGVPAKSRYGPDERLSVKTPTSHA